MMTRQRIFGIGLLLAAIWTLAVTVYGTQQKAGSLNFESIKLEENTGCSSSSSSGGA